MSDHQSTPEPAGPRIRGGARRIAVPALALVLALVAGWVLYPAPRPLADGSGDADLIARVRASTGDRGGHLAVAVITDDGVRTARFDAAATDRFEIGSITKTMTGELFAIAIQQGEVAEDDTLAQHLPELGAGEIGRVTLRQAATHTGGIPSLVTDPAVLAGSLAANLTAGNPYRQTVAEQLASASTMSADAAPHSYSNLGFQLLGQALARAAGMDYRELVAQRIWQPLGMSTTTLPYDDAELTDQDLRGTTATRRTAAPWTGASLGPAGAVRSDLDDMVRYATALREKSLPGEDATEPREQEDEETRIGWAWVTSTIRDRRITWHNGGTGGFSSFVEVDRERGVAFVVLSGTSGQADQIAADLIGQEWTR